MTEFDPTQFGPDELFLSGRLQVDTAINVLELTSVNPRVEESLRTLCKVHELTTTPGAKDDLKVYLQGGVTGAMRADIVTSALLVEGNPSLPRDIRIAARGLLDVLDIVN